MPEIGSVRNCRHFCRKGVPVTFFGGLCDSQSRSNYAAVVARSADLLVPGRHDGHPLGSRGYATVSNPRLLRYSSYGVLCERVVFSLSEVAGDSDSGTARC